MQHTYIYIYIFFFFLYSFLIFLQGTLRLIDSGDYISTEESSPPPSSQERPPVTTSAMLQLLQPSPNPIQSMLIQQILTSPEQVYYSYDVTGQCISLFIVLYQMSLFIYEAYNRSLRRASYVMNNMIYFSSLFSFSFFRLSLTSHSLYMTNISLDVAYCIRL